MKAKTLVYAALALALVFLVWQYVLPTTNLQISSAPQHPGTPKDAMIQGVKESYGYWVAVSEGPEAFSKGEKYSQETLGLASTFGDIKFFCAQNVSCTGNPETAYILSDFSAEVTAYCPRPNAGFCCIGIGMSKLGLSEVCG